MNTTDLMINLKNLNSRHYQLIILDANRYKDLKDIEQEGIDIQDIIIRPEKIEYNEYSGIDIYIHLKDNKSVKILYKKCSIPFDVFSELIENKLLFILFDDNKLFSVINDEFLLLKSRKKALALHTTILVNTEE